MNPYDAEVSELIALSDECLAWAMRLEEGGSERVEFKRLALALDDIAKRICEKWTESLP